MTWQSSPSVVTRHWVPRLAFGTGIQSPRASTLLPALYTEYTSVCCLSCPHACQQPIKSNLSAAWLDWRKLSLEGQIMPAVAARRDLRHAFIQRCTQRVSQSPCRVHTTQFDPNELRVCGATYMYSSYTTPLVIVRAEASLIMQRSEVSLRLARGRHYCLSLINADYTANRYKLILTAEITNNKFVRSLRADQRLRGTENDWAELSYTKVITQT